MYHSNEDKRYGIPKLNSANYFTWKQQVEMALIKEELWEVVDKPTPDNPDADWQRKNRLAMATIGLLLGEKYLVHIKHEDTAIGIWKKLERTHQSDNLGTRLTLYRKLFTARYQIGENMEDHLTDIMITAEQLQDRGYTVPTEILCAALMGSLPKEYNSLITAVEARNAEDINPEYVRAKIMEEATRQKHTTHNSTMAMNTRYRGTPRSSRPNQTCYYCKKIGHIRSDCRLLMKHEAHQPMQGNRTPSKNNYHHKGNRPQIKFTTGMEPEGAPESTEGASARLMHHASVHRAMSIQDHQGDTKNTKWIIDTGAGSHMCRDLNVLTNTTKMDHETNIMTASGQQHKVTWKGDHKMEMTSTTGANTHIWLRDVLYVPELTDNLISISKLDQNGLEIFFKEHKCWILHHDAKYQVGSLQNNLYIWEETPSVQSANACRHIWHQRLGHRDMNYIKRTQQNTDQQGLQISECHNDKICEVCQITKKHHEKFNVSNRTPDKPFHTIHADLCGPISPSSLGGNKYILSIIDDYSRYSKVYTIANKYQATSRIQQFVEEGINKFSRRPLILRTDGGGEFQNNTLNEYLGRRGIKHQLSLPYMHQENGLIERYNRTLLEGTRALLKEARLPDNLWGEMACTSTYLNNLIVKSDKNKTPYELWHGKPPKYDHLKIIGSKCYFINTSPNKSKLTDRGIPGILIGYGSSRHFYRLLNLNNNTICESRGVTFEKETCPYHEMEYSTDKPSINKEQTIEELPEPDDEDEPLVTRKSSRTNKGKPPETLTYGENGSTIQSHKDWYDKHNLQGQSTSEQLETLGEC